MTNKLALVKKNTKKKLSLKTGRSSLVRTVHITVYITKYNWYTIQLRSSDNRPSYHPVSHHSSDNSLLEGRGNFTVSNHLLNAQACVINDSKLNIRRTSSVRVMNFHFQPDLDAAVLSIRCWHHKV